MLRRRKPKDECVVLELTDGRRVLAEKIPVGRSTKVRLSGTELMVRVRAVPC